MKVGSEGFERETRGVVRDCGGRWKRRPEPNKRPKFPFLKGPLTDLIARIRAL